MRQRKLKWADEFLDNSPILIKEFPFTLEGNCNEIEIGCGKGNFILNKAKQNPNINYIGMDIQKSCIAIACKKVTEEQIENVKFCYVNAKDLIEKCIGKFDTIYLNFSDPWPKARHEKRRLTSPNFLSIYKEILKENGMIYFRTDERGLYEYSLTTLEGNLFTIIENEEDCKLKENEIISEYETKFRAAGNPIYKITAKRR